MSRSTRKSRTYGAPDGESPPLQQDVLPWRWEFNLQQVAAHAQTNPSCASPGSEQGRVGRAYRRSCRCTLPGYSRSPPWAGSPGGARRGQGQKLTLSEKSCYHKSHVLWAKWCPPQTHVEILTPSTSEHDCIRDTVLKCGRPGVN